MVVGTLPSARLFSGSKYSIRWRAIGAAKKLIELVDYIKRSNWVGRYPWENLSGMFDIVASDVRFTVSLEDFLQLLFGSASSPQIHELVTYAKSLDNKSNTTEIKQEELTEEQRVELEQLFYEVDKDGSGTIDIGELYELLNEREYDPNRWWEDESDLTFTRKELEDLCALYDMDNNSELDMEEFVMMMRDVVEVAMYAINIICFHLYK